MPKYKLILTVQDSFGMTKEIDGGEISLDVAEALTPDDVKKIEEALPLENYLKKEEIHEELEEYATDEEVDEAVKPTVKYGSFKFKGASK